MDGSEYVKTTHSIEVIVTYVVRGVTVVAILYPRGGLVTRATKWSELDPGSAEATAVYILSERSVEKVLQAIQMIKPPITHEAHYLFDVHL